MYKLPYIHNEEDAKNFFMGNNGAYIHKLSTDSIDYSSSYESVLEQLYSLDSFSLVLLTGDDTVYNIYKRINYEFNILHLGRESVFYIVDADSYTDCAKRLNDETFFTSTLYPIKIEDFTKIFFRLINHTISNNNITKSPHSFDIVKTFVSKGIYINVCSSEHKWLSRRDTFELILSPTSGRIINNAHAFNFSKLNILVVINPHKMYRLIAYENGYISLVKFSDLDLIASIRDYMEYGNKIQQYEKAFHKVYKRTIAPVIITYLFNTFKKIIGEIS